MVQATDRRCSASDTNVIFCPPVPEIRHSLCIVTNVYKKILMMFLYFVEYFILSAIDLGNCVPLQCVLTSHGATKMSSSAMWHV